MDVIAWSQNLTPQRAAESGVEWVPQHELFERSDVLSVHLVLSERTMALVSATRSSVFPMSH
ncbi:NAD(P)-dependent oxidoreductase [Mycobacterium sp. 48b]|uniref:NAD(P)-dependent oxidoreductase n=1 Tax=Mycobacterium sp. 48b TaxID=3400426 RepID=UPI003AB04C89